MRCQQATELMSLQLDRLLDEAKRRELETHLSDCTTCQQTWFAMRRVSRLLEAAPVVAPAPGFAQRVNERINRRIASRQSRRQLLTGYIILGAGVLLLLALPLTYLATPLSAVGRAVAGQPGILGQGVQLLGRFGSIATNLVEACWLLCRAVARALPQTTLLVLGILAAALLTTWLELVSGRPLAYRRTPAGS